MLSLPMSNWSRLCLVQHANVQSSSQYWGDTMPCVLLSCRAVKVGLVDDQLVVNPTPAQLASSPLNLTYAGTATRAVMVEAAAHQVGMLVARELLLVYVAT